MDDLTAKKDANRARVCEAWLQVAIVMFLCVLFASVHSRAQKRSLVLEVCERVGVALEDKFHSQTRNLFMARTKRIWLVNQRQGLDLAAEER